jgi:hypothetical protein
MRAVWQAVWQLCAESSLRRKNTTLQNLVSVTDSEMIVCIGLMSSVPRASNPLFLKVYVEGADQTVMFHHVCYCSMDIFEEKEQAIKASGQGAKAADTYLGHLMYMEEYKLSGYVTSSGIRIALVFEDSDSKDASLIKAFMRKLHSLYADCVSNPFYQPGQVLSSSNSRKMWLLWSVFGTQMLFDDEL